MHSKNYYSVLKVKTNASLQDIKSAYLKLSLKYERFGGNGLIKKIVKTKIKDIVVAYYILSDPKRRQEYDIYHNKRNSCISGLKFCIYLV